MWCSCPRSAYHWWQVIHLSGKRFPVSGESPPPFLSAWVLSRVIGVGHLTKPIMTGGGAKGSCSLYAFPMFPSITLFEVHNTSVRSRRLGHPANEDKYPVSPTPPHAANLCSSGLQLCSWEGSGAWSRSPVGQGVEITVCFRYSSLSSCPGLKRGNPVPVDYNHTVWLHWPCPWSLPPGISGGVVFFQSLPPCVRSAAHKVPIHGPLTSLWPSAPGYESWVVLWRTHNPQTETKEFPQ